MPVQIYYRKNSSVPIRTLKKCMEEILKYSGRGVARVEISLVGEKTILKYNQKYRKKSRVTDVLSFPLDPRPMKRGMPWHLGEIVIATPVAKKQAQRAKRKLIQQVVRLGIHGYLHLQGLDHEKGAKDLKEFEKLEKKYLSHLDQKGFLPWDGSLQF